MRVFQVFVGAANSHSTLVESQPAPSSVPTPWIALKAVSYGFLPDVCGNGQDECHGISQAVP